MSEIIDAGRVLATSMHDKNRAEIVRRLCELYESASGQNARLIGDNKELRAALDEAARDIERLTTDRDRLEDERRELRAALAQHQRAADVATRFAIRWLTSARDRGDASRYMVIEQLPDPMPADGGVA